MQNDPSFVDSLTAASKAIADAVAAVNAVVAALPSSPVVDRIQGTVNALATSALNLLNDSSSQIDLMIGAETDARAAVAAGSMTNATDQNGNAVDTTQQQ